MQQTAGLFQRRTALANLPTPVRSPRGGIYLEPRSRLTAFCRGFLFVGNGCQASIGQQNAYEKSRPRDLGSEDTTNIHRSNTAARMPLADARRSSTSSSSRRSIIGPTSWQVMRPRKTTSELDKQSGRFVTTAVKVICAQIWSGCHQSVRR